LRGARTAVVGDVDDERAVVAEGADLDVRRARVLGRVAEGLLDDPVGRELEMSRKAASGLVDVKADAEVGLPYRARQLREGAKVRLRFEHPGRFAVSASDGGDGEPGVVEGLGSKGLDLVEGFAGPVGSTAEPPPSGPGVEGDGDETMAHGVMDIAGDPHALRDHGRGGLGFAEILELLVTQTEQCLLSVAEAEEITDRKSERDDEQV
jgi:hypothetical protein